MITLDEVKKIYDEHEDAIVWAQKWSPYALLALEEEYQKILSDYSTQENITKEEVISLVSK
jgi:hypothetical protein